LSPLALALTKKNRVVILCAGNKEDLTPQIRKLRFQQVRIFRNIRPFADGVALWRLWRVFLLERFLAVHSMSPKAGFLGMLAAWLAGVPVRIHTFTGQVWAARVGWLRFVLKTADTITAMLATHILIDSHSQRRFLIAKGVLKKNQGVVVAKGSVVGVDLKRFRPNHRSRTRYRRLLDIPPSAVVALFLGRFQPDKGVYELALAFRQATKLVNNLYLLMAGPDEAEMTESLKKKNG
jgi:glycosyltransferase involved in cell wall biosynthesis